MPEYQRQEISNRLVSLKNYIPSDFSRKLIYSGPIVFFNILPQNLYQHFLCLHVAITILIDPILCADVAHLNVAEELLIHFVEDFENLYGRENVTHNIHNLLHIVIDVKLYGL